MPRAAEAPPGPATPEAKSRAHLDAAPVAALPLGDLAGSTGPALGGMIGVSYDLDDRWDRVFHGGYLAGATTSYELAGVSVSSSLSYAPVLGGVVSLGLQLDVLDVRAGLMTADLGHAGTSTSGLLSLGFRFASP